MELLQVEFTPFEEDRLHFSVKVKNLTRGGEGYLPKVPLPFVDLQQTPPKNWRFTLLKVLESDRFNAGEFSEAEQQWLVEQGLLNTERSSFQHSLALLTPLGRALYQAIFPPGRDTERVLTSALTRVRADNTHLHIRFAFPADASKYARLPDYPWELLYDGQKFLSQDVATFSRYIEYPDPQAALLSTKTINVLLVSSGAYDSANQLKKLPKAEREAVSKGLRQAEAKQAEQKLEAQIRLTVLESPTFADLRQFLQEHRGEASPHVLHFDGHGFFGRRCEQCRRAYLAGATHCEDDRTPLSEVQGYLLFEHDDREADYVSTRELGELFRKASLGDKAGQSQGVTVAVLSACKSGMSLGSESVFNGIAQNLIGNGVPAVLAMQYSVRADAAIAFAEHFYSSLCQKDSLARAVSLGRSAMGTESNQWYRPVLYLRWQDNEGGQLFAPEQPALEQRIGVPFQAPPLPSYYVDRTEVSQELKARLLQPRSTNGSSASALMISAIHGLGAIGKSTLATALAHNPEIQAHFSDGIFWATLGQQPNLLALLGSWIQALGDYNFQGVTVEASMIHLRTLLQEKVALLVVDDAWDASHAQAFLVGGAKCQVLITSRDKLIATSVGASLYSLDVMSPEQSLQLLAQRLGRNLTPTEIPQAEELAEEVGYLPLALELAAAQVADGIAWAELLQDLRAEVAYLEALDLVGAEDITDEASSKRLSLRKSLNLSIRRLTTERRQQFAWFGVLPEDVIIMPAMAATLWNVNSATNAERKARDTLRYLRDKAILLDGVPLADGTAIYRLHDMFHDLAKNLLTAASMPDAEGHLAGLGLTLLQAHAELLNRYRQKTRQQQWHTVPNDGYIHARLIWHLEQAGWHAEIHALLGETAASGRNGWYEARERLGQTAGYITDVRQAWALLQQTNPETLTAQMMGLQCCYVLILSSLRSLANIPGELLVALVKKRVWLPEQGLAYARQVVTPQRKAAHLILLVDELPPVFKLIALKEALEAVQAIRNVSDQDYTLAFLADKLPSELLFQALTEVQAIRDEPHWSRLLALLADKLQPEFLPKALEIAQAIENKKHRFEALVALANELPELFPQLLEVLKTIGDESFQADALAALADKLPPEFLPQALEIIQAIENKEYRFKALVTLADKLPELLPQVLEVARAIQASGNERERVDKLVTLLKELYRRKHITDEKYLAYMLLAALTEKSQKALPQVLKILEAIRHQNFQADAWVILLEMFFFLKTREITIDYDPDNSKDLAYALTALANKLPEVLPQVLKVLKEIRQESFRVRALVASADGLPLALLTQAQEAAQAIENERERVDALAALAGRLPELLPQVLEAAQAIENEWHRADALAALADKLPLELLPQALEIAQIGYADALVVLIDKLPLDMLPQVLEIAQAIRDEGNRAYVLMALADKLPPELLLRVLEFVQAIKSRFVQTRTLAALAGKLPPEVLPQVLEATQVIGDQWYQANALAALANELPEVLPQALEAAQAIGGDGDRAYMLTALANKLPLELLPQALEAAQAIGDEWYQANALAALANKLPEVLPQVLEAAQAIESEEYRSEALAALANKLPSELLPQALEAAQAIEGDGDRAYMLTVLANKLPLELLPQALEAAQAIESEEYRSKVLAALANKLPEVLSQALEAAQAIGDKENRAYALAALADKVPEVLSQALEAAQAIEHKPFASRTLAALMGKLPPELSPQALEVAQTIEDKKDRFKALVALADKLPEVFPQVLEVLKAIKDERFQADALAALADKLPSKLLPQTLEVAQAMRFEEYRFKALAALANKLPSESLPQALEAAQAIKNEKYLSDALTALAEKLPPELLPQALEAAQAIGDEQHRSDALAALFPQLVQFSSVELCQFWFSTLNWLAALRRPHALQCWASLAPVIFKLGDKEAVAEIANAIDQVCHWWK